MGCSSSRDLTPPKTPLEVIVYEEARQAQLQRIQRKEERQIEKLRKKLERKRKKQLKKSRKKNARRSTASSRRKNTDATRVHKSEASKLKDLDDEIEEETQALINTDLCMFLLNQIAFSMEFFGNFESESTSILAEFLNKENEFNKNLEDQSVLLANPLDAAVQKWLKYKPLHGADKYRALPLQAPVIYVVFENIDISRPDDSDYDSIPPLCSVIMETKSYRTTPCKEELIEVLREIQWKGYVRLKLREDPKAKKSNETKNVKDKFKTSKTSQNEIYGSNFMGQASSGYGTEQDYDYAYITKLNTQKPLAELKMNGCKKLRKLGAKVLPDSCISYLGDFLDARLMEENDGDMYDFKKEENYNPEVDVEKRIKPFRNMETLQAIRRYKLEVERRRTLLQQQYINSQRFMGYFAELMRQKMAKRLSIGDEDLANATYRGASIYTRDYEVIPAIHVAQNAQHWPECTAQFRLRERPVRIHPRSGENVQWPTRAMIKQIETFGYHVIPLGYAPKRRKNPFRELEWCIVFPKAERYLERHLSWTQVKILIIMKVLVKTFIEPKEPGKRLMFVMELLRTHLFWECERNFTIWPEEFLGDVLLRFIDTFKSSLKQKRFRDYFIQERNLLDGIPEHSILRLVSILADIASNPLMHILVAFRNLDFNEKFFPKLDLKKIFKNLTAENSAKLKQLSKNSNFFADPENGSDGDERDFEVVDADPDGLIDLAHHEEIAPEKFSRRGCQLLYESEKAKRVRKQRRGSVESIEVEFFFNNNLPEHSTYESVNVALEFLRRSNLLEILMDHFLAALRKSIKFRNLILSQTWLLQLQRLLKYYRSYGSELLARDYENSTQLLEDALQELQSSYGALDFEVDDNEMSDSSVNEKKFQIKHSNDVNPYEEVMPMNEGLPTIQKAMKTWESKLHKQYTESLRSSKSTRGSKGSIKIRDIQVEVHSTKRKEKRRFKGKEKKEKRLERKRSLENNRRNSTTERESSENESEINADKSSKQAGITCKIIDHNKIQLEKKNSLSSSSDSNEIYKCQIKDMMKLDYSTAYETRSESSNSVEFDSNTNSLRKSTKAQQVKVHLSQISTKKRTSCSKLETTKTAKSATNPNDAKQFEIKKCASDRNYENNDAKIASGQKAVLKQPKLTSKNKKILKNGHKKNKSKMQQTNKRKLAEHKNKTVELSENKNSLNMNNGESENFDKEDFQSHTKIPVKRNKSLSKKVNTIQFTEAYDNQAYSSDSTDQIHESINLSLKVLKLNPQVTVNCQSQSQTSTQQLNSKVETNLTKAGNLTKSASTKNLKDKKEIILPRPSIRSQVSFKENRRITYKTDPDEEVESLPQSISETEIEHFEFKCLEDSSINVLQEFEASENESENSHIKHRIDPSSLFAYNVVNEKLSTCSINDFSKCCNDEDEGESERTFITQQTDQNKQDSNHEGCHDIELKDISQKAMEGNIEDIDIDSKTKNEENSTKKSFFSKYINRETVLKKLTIISPDMIDALAESRQKIKDSLSEDKRAHVRSILKKRTLQLKEAVLK